MNEILKQNEKKTAPMHTTTIRSTCPYNNSHIILNEERARVHTQVHKKSADLLIVYSQLEAFALPNSSK